MAEITRYIVVDAEDQEDDHEYARVQDAIDEACRRGGCAVAERTYVYDDTALVWTPSGELTWPPEDGPVGWEEG